MRRYKVQYGDPMEAKSVYVNADNPYKAQSIIMDKLNIFRCMILMTTWVDNKEVK